MRSITFADNVFHLSTNHTSYLFKVSDYNHLEHIYYGKKVNIEDSEALSLKRVVPYGTSVNYAKNSDTYSLDVLPQEYGFKGRGDYREPAILLRIDGDSDLDLKVYSYGIFKGDVNPEDLPSSYGADETLVVHLKDEIRKIELDLIYAVFYKNDVITRRTVVRNNNSSSIIINKLMSLSLDIQEEDLVLMNLNGGWINEANETEKEIKMGSYIPRSRTGFSSNKTNPAFLLRKKNTDEEKGEVWGFNLIYSGNHYESVSLDDKSSVRILSGIDTEDFNYELKEEKAFETPVAVMTYSANGLNEMSHNFHNFINNHLITSNWKNRERPILINSWEAFMFDFKKNNLLSLASEAAKLGVELFVLDDGWFANRDDDTKGLGDYDCNLDKLPGGLSELSKKINDLGMGFGLWVEPEAINVDSNLYKIRPDWAIKEKGREDVFGRHELLLDLRKKPVRDYIVRNVAKLIDENNIEYIKWDVNRNLIGLTGEENHQYILGLYDVLKRIFIKRPHVLFESCASGGNRFDLGMLCYSPQIWASDNTDPIERLEIQKNLSYFYPLSTMGSHISASPHSQTLRTTPLNTRFNVACYGCLGYELDLKMLSNIEKKEIKKQIDFYKENRSLFQYGIFYRYNDSLNKTTFEVLDDEKCIVTKFRKKMSAGPGVDKLLAYNLKDINYQVNSRPFMINIKQFGNLINFVLPVKVNAEGILVNEVSKFKGMEYKGESFKVSGKALMSGIPLNNVFAGTGYNENVRLPLEYGSEMYVIREDKDESRKEE